MNAMEKLLLMAERCETATSEHQLSSYPGDTQSTCVGDFTGYVSVVKFCGRPILPPVVRISMCSTPISHALSISQIFVSKLWFFKYVYLVHYFYRQ